MEIFVADFKCTLRFASVKNELTNQKSWRNKTRRKVHFRALEDVALRRKK